MTGSRMPEYIRKTILGRLVSHEGLEFHLRANTGVYKGVYRIAQSIVYKFRGQSAPPESRREIERLCEDHQEPLLTPGTVPNVAIFVPLKQL